MKDREEEKKKGKKSAEKFIPDISAEIRQPHRLHPLPFLVLDLIMPGLPSLSEGALLTIVNGGKVDGPVMQVRKETDSQRMDVLLKS